NDVLQFLQADFKLVDTKPKTRLRNTTRLFNINFYGSHTIDLSSVNDNISHFGNSLSESDKRLLAFSFFIAGLKVQETIQNKVIIFDDPMSSLDAERKLRTVQILKKLIDENQPRQVIILTHERIFFSMLNECISARKCFKIIYDPQNKSSFIETMKPNEEYLDDYYKQLEDLKALENASDDEITWDSLRPIRDILEQLLKKKYYFHIKQEIQGGGSISAFILKLKTDGVFDDEKSKKINNNLAHFWNHDDSNSIIKRQNFSVGDLRGIIKTFFEVIEII
ncbi:MAG: AAA family ATPase, partial [Actinobacteria bacterium]|nr:AAA family ATPase [Actinomycetota bacterium]